MKKKMIPNKFAPCCGNKGQSEHKNLKWFSIGNNYSLLGRKLSVCENKFYE